MSVYTALNAPTQFITASNGTKFAYRHLGPALASTNALPLVMHIHYRANMDLWDPLLLSCLSAHRPVLIFDEPGVGRTPGTVPTTYQGWADDVILFTDALGLKKIDLLGFSMGGIAVSYVALKRPVLVRRLILAGTTASVPMDKEKIEGVVKPREQAPPEQITALSGSDGAEEEKKSLAFSFFYNDEAGRTAFEKYWSRVLERKVAGEDLNLRLLGKEGSQRQFEAAIDTNTPSPRGSFDRLHELKMPVLVANGDNDTLIPSSRSWELYRNIESAQLIMYPKAGHGFIWQYAEMFAKHVNEFLDAEEYDRLPAAKL
jgi:pimeloyl-ACP methyl ester carboxylesterase